MINENQLSTLSQDVYEKLGKPVNVNVVRAMLESMSIRNIDAKQDYHVEDLQELAELVFAYVTDREFLKDHPVEVKVNEQFKSELTSASDYLKLKTKYFFYYYPTGLFHGMPVFLQIATIIVFGYSMWTYSEFNQLQSTAVVTGVIYGLIGTGGFVQVIGRQLSHYWYCGDFQMARLSTIKVFRDALIFMGILAVGLLIINFFADFYPFRFLYIVFAYSYSIGILLLLTAVFHPLKQRIIISVAFLIGLGAALTLHIYTDLITYYTHWIGIWTAIVIMFIYLNLFFRRKVKKVKEFNRATSKSASLVYKSHRYFFYGLVFFVFIFTDRFMAWSTSHDGNALPYIVYYEKNYEVGMDIAILIFFLLAGVLEFGVASFSTLSDQLQKLTSYDQAKKFNERMVRLYREHIAILIASGIAMTYMLYRIIWINTGYERAFDEGLDFVSIEVSILGGIGYIFVAWGMLNSLYLFTMNKPTKPLNAIMVALLVNVAVGLVASRVVSYEYSVLGFLSGSIVYMGMTLKSTLKFFKNLDYYYYASY